MTSTTKQPDRISAIVEAFQPRQKISHTPITMSTHIERGTPHTRKENLHSRSVGGGGWGRGRLASSCVCRRRRRRLLYRCNIDRRRECRLVAYRQGQAGPPKPVLHPPPC